MYDRVASMRSSYSGVPKRTNEENQLAVYCGMYDVYGKIVSIRNLFYTLNQI